MLSYTSVILNRGMQKKKDDRQQYHFSLSISKQTRLSLGKTHCRQPTNKTGSSADILEGDKEMLLPRDHSQQHKEYYVYIHFEGWQTFT